PRGRGNPRASRRRRALRRDLRPRAHGPRQRRHHARRHGAQRAAQPGLLLAAAEIRAHLAADEPCGVIFGPERTGLVNADITLADTVLNVPLNPGFSSRPRKSARISPPTSPAA